MRNKNNGFDWRGRMVRRRNQNGNESTSAPSGDRRKLGDCDDEYCRRYQDQAEVEMFKTFVRTLGWCLILIGTSLIV